MVSNEDDALNALITAVKGQHNFHNAGFHLADMHKGNIMFCKGEWKLMDFGYVGYFDGKFLICVYQNKMFDYFYSIFMFYPSDLTLCP